MPTARISGECEGLALLGVALDRCMHLTDVEREKVVVDDLELLHVLELVRELLPPFDRPRVLNPFVQDFFKLLAELLGGQSGSTGGAVSDGMAPRAPRLNLSSSSPSSTMASFGTSSSTAGAGTDDPSSGDLRLLLFTLVLVCARRVLDVKVAKIMVGLGAVGIGGVPAREGPEVEQSGDEVAIVGLVVGHCRLLAIDTTVPQLASSRPLSRQLIPTCLSSYSTCSTQGGCGDSVTLFISTSEIWKLRYFLIILYWFCGRNALRSLFTCSIFILEVVEGTGTSGKGHVQYH